MNRSHGNEQCQKVVEYVLEEIKQGRIGHISLTWGELAYRDDQPAQYKGAVRGDVRLQEGALVAMRNLTKQLEDEIANTTIPKDSIAPKDRFYYDCATGPMCFDFCNWLVARRMEMIEAGLTGMMKIAFFHGKDGKSGFDHPGRRMMLENVYRPMLSLIGAVEHECAIGGNVVNYYLPSQVVDKYKAGQDIARFKAPHETMVEVYKWLGKRKRPMVITLRESTAWEQRNSNMEAWLKFGQDLVDAGHDVVFVRDTDKAFWAKPYPLEDCPRASIDVKFRMGLYQAAACNFFVSNGPHLLTVYSDVPYIVFIQLQPDGHPYEADTPRFWRQKMGVEPGDQFPWARPDQHIAWGPDTYENICAAWNTYQTFKEAAE